MEKHVNFSALMGETITKINTKGIDALMTLPANEKQAVTDTIMDDLHALQNRVGKTSHLRSRARGWR